LLTARGRSSRLPTRFCFICNKNAAEGRRPTILRCQRASFDRLLFVLSSPATGNGNIAIGRELHADGRRTATK
jgi:hypothetical protein